jgi:HNH endonuclease
VGGRRSLTCRAPSGSSSSWRATEGAALCRRPSAASPAFGLGGQPLHLGHRLLTVDHVVPRLKGGPAWLENEVAACKACNRARGHAAPLDWLRDCEARGLEPNRAAIEGSLRRLRDAIEERGGQRRARPYLDAQLRRLG